MGKGSAVKASLPHSIFSANSRVQPGLELFCIVTVRLALKSRLLTLPPVQW